MRARTFALIGLVAGAALTAEALQPADLDFKLYASSAGRYKVLFPGPARSETTDVKAPTGVRKLTLDSVQPAPGYVFMVTHVDVPDEVAKGEPGPRLDKVRDGIKGANGTVLSDKEVQVGVEKLPGRDLLVQKPTTVIRSRVVIAGVRLYQVMLEGPKEFVTSKDADRFIDSFEVTK